jgi:hypothetical protein
VKPNASNRRLDSVALAFLAGDLGSPRDQVLGERAGTEQQRDGLRCSCSPSSGSQPGRAKWPGQERRPLVLRNHP